MIEIFYDAIRATAGQPINLTVAVTDVEEPVTEGLTMVIYDKAGAMIAKSNGAYSAQDNMWSFVFPSGATKGLNGRYYYSIQHYGSNLCFRQPLYLIGQEV